MWDQRLGGGVMLAIAEMVGLPLLAAVMVAWMRADAVEARLVDVELDAQRAGAGVASAPEIRSAPVADGEPGRDRPWWESDPRFSRFRD
jgi:putative copper resistance protein D